MRVVQARCGDPSASIRGSVAASPLLSRVSFVSPAIVLSCTMFCWNNHCDQMPTRYFETVVKTLTAANASRYTPGDVFGAHVDAAYAESVDVQSLFTVNIYTSTVATRGETRFFHSGREGGGLAFACDAVAGDAVVFRQVRSLSECCHSLHT